jgi:putative membrane protein
MKIKQFKTDKDLMFLSNYIPYFFLLSLTVLFIFFDSFNKTTLISTLIFTLVLTPIYLFKKIENKKTMFLLLIVSSAVDVLIFFIFSSFQTFDIINTFTPEKLMGSIIFLIVSPVIMGFFLVFKLAAIDSFLKKNKLKSIKTFILGFLIGFADLIPGMSGGTFAFIFGIYEKFINSISSVNPKTFKIVIFNFSTFNFKKVDEHLKKTEIYFLLILGVGLFLAVFLVSKFLGFILKEYELYVMVFFLGLIAMSLFDFYKYMKNHTFSNILVLVIGFSLSISLMFFEPMASNSTDPWFIFLGGLLSISAMVVPGISGSYILLMLGLYQTFIFYLKYITYCYLDLVPFYFGILFGFLFLTKIINFLFQKHKIKIFYTIFGIILGSFILITNTIFFSNVVEKDTKKIILASEINSCVDVNEKILASNNGIKYLDKKVYQTLNFFEYLKLFILFILGFLTIKFFERIKLIKI